MLGNKNTEMCGHSYDSIEVSLSVRFPLSSRDTDSRWVGHRMEYWHQIMSISVG